MGKKNYSRSDISTNKTVALGIDGLLVIDENSTNECYHTINKQYFNKEKNICPACLSKKTRSSKVTVRKFKDIVDYGDTFNIVDILFHQRWFRCDNCQKSVFSENIDFAEKGCRYTNRLADKLAEGTLRYSYKKVCDFYVVPASTASVGSIMRRRIQCKESKFPEFETPDTIAIIELHYFGDTYPLILNVGKSGIQCMDILPDAAEATYITFLRCFDASKLKTVYIEPNEELKSAVAICFPAITPLISSECILRHAQNKFIEVIRSDGKRFPIKHKETELTKNRKFLEGYEIKKIKEGMNSRPRLNIAYEHYQKLFEIFDNAWNYEDLSKWASEIPKEVLEFEELIDLIEFYEYEIQSLFKTNRRLPENYLAVIRGICDAVSQMPHCIFDVLRARCILTTPYDTVSENGIQKRLGISADRFIENINEITRNIKEEREYGLE